MKLSLYLPNFRDEVTARELEDLTALAEDLDRPKALPVIARGKASGSRA